ncbi:M55 family metallopeptidase [Porticoccaceae bacterium]|nr:M55 family metallopeptidase [Porticoccaceae bacterium]
MATKRLYISADIEGVAGVVSGEHMMPGGFEYQQAREWFTAEVAAACDSAFKQGIDEVVVSDSHGNGQSLMLDRLPENVQVVRSWPRPLCMMEGVDVGQYVGAMLIGYHAGASDLRGALRHTLHGGAITEVRLNGQVASETVISAATAAHFGVPTIMVSGDDAYIEHAQSVLPDVVGVTTKWAGSFTSARMLLPALVQQHIAEGTVEALDKLQHFKSGRLPDNIVLEVVCMQRKAAELLDYLPNVERTDAYTIKFVGKDMIEISKFLQFLLASGSLTPS